MGDIDDILNNFQEKFGIKRTEQAKVDVIPTGYETIDTALGIGGIPIGKTTEISGEPGAGKNVLAYHIISEAQRQNMIVMWVDAEKGFSFEYAKKHGVDPTEIVVCDPPSGEMAMQLMAYYMENGLVDLIVIDSLPALVSTSELKKVTGNYKIQERMIGDMLKHFMTFVDKLPITFICLNQIRLDFQTKKPKTPFNEHVNYFASVRIHLSRLNAITKWRKIRGYKVEANIHKNNYHERTATSFDLMI